ncbi:sensor histidine kinase [Glycomyces paridis]|uniref:histidine kinase n=1 Tax=Glycomyces paridis TaxID=2126555 RepID=A0A4S8PNA0_9ACTN|nr:ATP-binding protein [Glycomyces paridis]THV32247.1 HAMP domain-containing protein [Glycomyces paridis]
MRGTRPRLWWRPESVRARTTVGATVVVALALIVAGFLVVALLRGNLLGRAELTAEVNARSVAASLAAGVDPAALDLPDDEEEVVQVLDAEGAVVAAGEELEDLGPVADFAPAAVDRDGDSDEDEDDEDRDEEPDDDSAGGVVSGIAYRTLGVSGEDAQYRFAAMTATAPGGEVYTVYSGASLETQEEAVDSVTAAMLWSLAPLLAVVAVVTWLVTRRALRPVGAIQKELIEITGGDLSRRVPVPASRDEIHSLATTTNMTLAALEASVAQQRRFVADASHELRSPLAILRTQLEVAQGHPDLLDLEATLGDVVRLQDLAADLLLLARLDAGERPPHVAVAFTELVREEVARRAATDRVPVRLELEEDLSVFGVRGHLARAVGNLLANAQRHAESAVSVRLAVEDEVWLRLDVADDGNGVPAGQRRMIFDRFVRLDESRSRDEGGAGLGLAIVQDVAVAHRGMVHVLDAPEGGALFRMVLRRAD